MQRTTPISEIMRKNPITIAPNDPMERAETLFEKHGFHHLPVIENGVVCGIVSFSDYLKTIRTLFGTASEKVKNDEFLASMLAKDMMTKTPFCLPPDAPIEQAMDMLRGNHFHAILVVEGAATEHRLVGIVTTQDLLLAFERAFFGKTAG